MSSLLLPLSFALGILGLGMAAVNLSLIHI